MRRIILLASLLPAVALAQSPQCWITYQGFHDHVQHIDLEMCPYNTPDAEQGFCRAAISGDTLTIYTFRHNAAADTACLTGVLRQDLNSFMATQGVTFIKP